MSNILKEDLETRSLLRKINELTNLLKEEDINSTTTNEIPINDSSFPGILEQQKESLNQKLPNVVFNENPFTLNKNNNTVTLKAKITNLNLGFIITTDISDGSNGLFITTNAFNLNDNTLQTLNVLNAHASIFQKEWTVNEVEKKLNIKNIN